MIDQAATLTIFFRILMLVITHVFQDVNIIGVLSNEYTSIHVCEFFKSYIFATDLIFFIDHHTVCWLFGFYKTSFPESISNCCSFNIGSDFLQFNNTLVQYLNPLDVV